MKRVAVKRAEMKRAEMKRAEMKRAAGRIVVAEAWEKVCSVSRRRQHQVGSVVSAELVYIRSNTSMPSSSSPRRSVRAVRSQSKRRLCLSSSDSARST